MNTLFIALPLDKIIKNQLERLCFGIPNIQWMEHHHFHLTLLYIGPVDGMVQLDIQDALAKIKVPPFSLSLEGVGYFPSKNSNGVLWAGAHLTNELSLLKKAIDQQLKPIIPQTEQKPFKPHVTLGRFKNINERRLLDYLDAQSFFASTQFFNDTFVLMKSQKTVSETIIYEEIARFPLKAPIDKLRILYS